MTTYCEVAQCLSVMVKYGKSTLSRPTCAYGEMWYVAEFKHVRVAQDFNHTAESRTADDRNRWSMFRLSKEQISRRFRIFVTG